MIAASLNLGYQSQYPGHVKPLSEWTGIKLVVSVEQARAILSITANHRRVFLSKLFI